LDGSIPDALFKKVGLLRENEGKVLAGRLGTLLNEVTLLPQELCYVEDSHTIDQPLWARAAEKLPKNGHFCLIWVSSTMNGLMIRVKKQSFS